ncbi:MAG: T9SS type A sorting domain-containing protein, partial [Chitinispirillia bacterium]|nr:T9SS type A sorting domain-containing protein [Chitinispirillia bacterium]
QWGTGCYSVNTLHGDNAGKTCEQVIAECEADGALFHSVDPSVFTTANNHGDGVSCVDNGGVQIGGNTFTGKFCNYGACVNGVGDNCQTGGCYPERVGEGCSGGSVVDLCPCANLPPNQIAAGAACDDGDTGGGTGELCRDPQNRQLYCQWGTGCYSVNTLHGDNAGKTCEQVIDECNTVGFGVYHSVNPSVLNAGNNFGDDIVCGAAGGVKVDATGALRSCGRRAAAPISAFYTKGSVSVNWNAASKISSGTISLVNIKGAAVASASIKANSSSISRKLGSKLPAGMYFVRVDARDVNGKRIVLQVPVQIVK